jgi:hypothetical protein
MMRFEIQNRAKSFVDYLAVSSIITVVFQTLEVGRTPRNSSVTHSPLWAHVPLHF